MCGRKYVVDKRYQVFISSTFADLEEERVKVMEAIIECNCFPAGMEMFPAVDVEQFEYIKDIIKECDYYILIIAGRYGSLANDGKSYTEKEFEYAVLKNIPVLAFLKGNIETIPANHTDQDKDFKEKLIRFRERVKQGRLIKYWNTKEELGTAISKSLREAFVKTPRIGWIKADSLPIKIDINKQLYDEIKKELQVELYSGEMTLHSSIRLMDIIMLLGSFHEKIDIDTFELNVLVLLKNNIISTDILFKKELIGLHNTKFNLMRIDDKLDALNLVNIGRYQYEDWSIRLSELGEKIYKQEILAC